MSGLIIFRYRSDELPQNEKEQLMSKPKPIGIYFEHPHWFRPLFNKLDERKRPFLRIHAQQHQFDPGDVNGERKVSLVFNRMSPSAYRRVSAHGILYTHNYPVHH